MLNRLAKAAEEATEYMPFSGEEMLVADVNWPEVVRAVLREMREPDQDIRYAGMMKVGEWGANQGNSPQWLPPYNIETRWAGKRAKGIWRAMIDTILDEKSDARG